MEIRFSGNLRKLAPFTEERVWDKTVSGMLTRLEKGGYCGQAPFGYESISRGGEKQIIPTKDAKFIRAAFEVKAYERLPNAEIVQRLKAMGCKRLYKQRLTELFRNVAYCGMVRHNLLGDRIIASKRKFVISEKLFLMASDL